MMFRQHGFDWLWIAVGLVIVGLMSLFKGMVP